MMAHMTSSMTSIMDVIKVNITDIITDIYRCNIDFNCIRKGDPHMVKSNLDPPS